MDDEKRQKSEATDGVTPGMENDGAPGPIDPETGQHKSHWVLSAEERAKGFIRPLRMSYTHIGKRAPRYELRDLTDEEKERYAQFNYVKYEAYPLDDFPKTGKFWTQAELDAVGKGCMTQTIMRQDIAETFARDPSYYGTTFCACCGTYRPVDEFDWEDGTHVGD